ncbi:hypothetical protein TREMEDRAFT_68760 [Tremella mesenterica DSM 1558]|uniref:uncharacterized protein n=1 Tax=Tremella mesenterica (strain ATCC 24925 / CBS 8224 / DSM 1558 / NBRC 9311 / NRRL Y-6157 / RJB 2259-6 / UBC 559-6) TaxID=578456 RepID=UPI0003F4A383|nr:uncharacterized protein TREMEDRAFT_68760 [Tremella mesenterica DSM 1558]EIW69566.1 hypothetical protein TREMEDRAFT_68760 [Tremella mesenterica DSM 1558]
MTEDSQKNKRRRSQFRPCIDLHQGQVKQIVGGTLDLSSLASSSTNGLKTNYVSSHPPSYYSTLYRTHNLTGGHIIKLGSLNDTAALDALSAWPGGMQLGGGVTEDNAVKWLEAGASKVIVTSWLFPEGKFDLGRLERLEGLIGRDKLVVDLSCRKKPIVEQSKSQESEWAVAMNGWRTLTDMEITKKNIEMISAHCSELLVHAADVEGLCQGIDEELVKCLGEWTTIPCTYAGGAKNISDLSLVDRLSNGKVDITFGSCLDIFGGDVEFSQLVKVNLAHQE